AMFRFIAAHRSSGDASKDERSVLAAGIRLAAIVSGVLAVLLFAGADLIARFEHLPALAFTLRAMAPALVLTVAIIVLVAATLGARTSRVNLVVRGMVEPMALLMAVLVAWSVAPR